MQRPGLDECEFQAGFIRQRGCFGAVPEYGPSSVWGRTTSVRKCVLWPSNTLSPFSVFAYLHSGFVSSRSWLHPDVSVGSLGDVPRAWWVRKESTSYGSSQTPHDLSSSLHKPLTRSQFQISQFRERQFLSVLSQSSRSCSNDAPLCTRQTDSYQFP